MMHLQGASWYRRWAAHWRGSTVEAQNIRLLYLEIIGGALFNAVVAFNSIFAVRLGASNALIGWMSSIPALIVVLVTLPAGQWLEDRTRRYPIVLHTLFVYRAGFLLIALMPFVVADNRDIVLVALLLVMTLPQAVVGVGWSAVLADVVRPERRSEVVSLRNIILAATMTLTGLLAGRGLDLIAFPLNYQILYAVGFLGGLFSSLVLMRIQIPPPPAPATDAPTAPPPRLTWRGTLSLLRANPGFFRIIRNTLIYGIGPWMVTPLFAIFYVRNLGASNSWIGVLTSVINLTGILGYVFARRMVQRWGDRPVLAWTTVATGLYPALLAFSPSLSPILVLGALYGIVNSGLNLSHFSTLLKVCPEDRRPSAIALYTMIMNIGAFVSPLVGVALADIVGIRAMLVVGAVFWVAGGILHLIDPPETVSPGSTMQPAVQTT